MNQRERELLARVYACVDKVAAAQARNPADIKTIVNIGQEVRAGAKSLALAVSCLGFGDYTDCAEYLDEAEATLGVNR